MNPRSIRDTASGIYDKNYRTKSSYLSFIFNGKDLVTKDINNDALLERIFWLGLCRSL